MSSLQSFDNSNQNHESQALLTRMHEQHVTVNPHGFLMSNLPVQSRLQQRSCAEQCSGLYPAPNMGVLSSMQLQVAGTMSYPLGARIEAPSQQLMLPGTASFSPNLNNMDNSNNDVYCAVARSSDVLNNNVRGQSVSPTPIWGITGSYEPARGLSLGGSNLQQPLYGISTQNIVSAAASIYQYSSNTESHPVEYSNLLPPESTQGFVSGPPYSTTLLDGSDSYQHSCGQAASLLPAYYPANGLQAKQTVLNQGGVVGQQAYCSPLEYYSSQGYGGGQLSAAAKQKQPTKATAQRKKKAAPAKQRQGSKKQTRKTSCKRDNLLRKAQIADALALLAAADDASVTTTVQSPHLNTCQGLNETPLYSSFQPDAAAQLSMVAHDAHDPSGSGYMPSFDMVQSFIESGAAAQHTSSFDFLPSADVAATHISRSSVPPCTTFLDFKTCADSFTLTDVQQLQDSSNLVTQEQQAAVLYWQPTEPQAPLLSASPCLADYGTTTCLTNRLIQPMKNSDACYQGTVDALQPDVQGWNTAAAAADGLPASDILQEADMLNLPFLDAPCDVDAGLSPISSIPDCPPYQSAQYSVSSIFSDVPVNTYNVQSAATVAMCISLNDAGWSEGLACERQSCGLSSNSSSDFDMILDLLLDPEDVLGTVGSSTASAGACQQPVCKEASYWQPGGVSEYASTRGSDADEVVTLDLETLDVWGLSDSFGC